jgi:phosphoglycolate phosphatase
MSLAFRHLVFDLDGTLVDTKDDIAEAVNVTLEQLGLPRQEPRTLWTYVGHGVRVTLERALGAEHAALLDQAVAVFLPWYRAHLLDHSAVYPGLGDVIERLAADGAVFSLVSNKLEEMSAAIVAGLGLAARFPRVVGGDSMPAKKPHPMGLRAVMHAAGVAASATLMIGDSAIDVATGKNAGVATCGVLWGFTADGAIADAGADVLIANAAELEHVARRGLSLPPR